MAKAKVAPGDICLIPVPEQGFAVAKVLYCMQRFKNIVLIGWARRVIAAQRRLPRQAELVEALSFRNALGLPTLHLRNWLWIGAGLSTIGALATCASCDGSSAVVARRTIMKVSVDGGTPSVLASGSYANWVIAVDASSIFFAIRDSFTATPHAAARSMMASKFVPVGTLSVSGATSTLALFFTSNRNGDFDIWVATRAVGAES